MGHRGVSEDLAAGGGQHVHRARGGHARGHRSRVRHQDGQGRGTHRSVREIERSVKSPSNLIEHLMFKF